MDATLLRNPGFLRRLLATLMAGFGFSQEGARRVAAATQVVERAIKGGGPGQARWPVITAAGGAVKAKAPAGGIAAKSGNTPGGPVNCTLYTWDGTSETLSSNTVAVRNSYPSAVGASKDIWIVSWGGTYFVLTEAC